MAEKKEKKPRTDEHAVSFCFCMKGMIKMTQEENKRVNQYHGEKNLTKGPVPLVRFFAEDVTIGTGPTVTSATIKEACQCPQSSLCTPGTRTRGRLCGRLRVRSGLGSRRRGSRSSGSGAGR